MSSEKFPAPPIPTHRSSSAIIATRGSMAQSIPPAEPPPCLKPFAASALCFIRAGVRAAPSFSAVGMPKRKASSALPNGLSSRATPSTVPSPISTSMLPSPGPISPPPPFLRSRILSATSPAPFPAPSAARYSFSGAKGPGSDDHSGSNAPPIEGEEVHVGDLGSGSDFTPFLQHAGVPSTDIGSERPLRRLSLRL